MKLLIDVWTGVVVQRIGDTTIPVSAELELGADGPRGPIKLTVPDHELVPTDELANLRRIVAEGSSDTIAEVLRVIRIWKTSPMASADGLTPDRLEAVARNLELDFGIPPRPEQDREDSRAAWRCVCGHYNRAESAACENCHNVRWGLAAAPSADIRPTREEVDNAIGLATEALDDAGRPSHGVAILAAAILTRQT